MYAWWGRRKDTFKKKKQRMDTIYTHMYISIYLSICIYIYIYIYQYM